MATTRKYYHGLSNDRWIVECVFPDLEGGYFVEAGALGGKWGTATYVLEKELHWNGICVEPSETKFAQLRLNRSVSRLDSRLLYSRSGEEKEFAFFNDRPAYSGITDHLRKSMKAHMVQSAEQTLVTMKSTITLSDLLAHYDAPPIVHYVCLDTEGSEFEILRDFPFDDPYTILAVSVEGHRCDRLLESKGYIAVRNPFSDKESEAYYLHPRLEQHRGRLHYEGIVGDR